ncbi:uncharacterized protein LOC125205685 isoform X1 [Salvia hispanica]|uniref:uncharacterized protein LOC125205685 isoform X1 n=1 Tax=Salvia hispanica TaxID=49212 RepID=UPI00200949B0|nr:uncharacterized protein LOC125205685 isoform X1 [Salvia hispanica]
MTFFVSSSIKSEYFKLLKQLLSPRDGKTCGVSSPASASTSASPNTTTLPLERGNPDCALTANVSPNFSPTVHDFHLSFDAHIFLDGGVDSSFVENCVLYAINHGLWSLHLQILYPGYSLQRLPATFFASKTLQELDLRVCGFHSIEPVSGLPEMEKLTLIKYSRNTPLDIKAPKLRPFKLYGCYRLRHIYAPLLTSFTYRSPHDWECAHANLPMLEQVDLDIHKSKYYRDQNHINFLTILHQLRNATIVSLTLDTIKILQSKVGFSKQIPHILPNMKCLKVMEGCHGNWTVTQSVMKYLTCTFNCKVEHSPNLLVIADEDQDEYNIVGKDGYN